ncbi:response regulator [Agromyces sp. M3QZ16-3]|uniref:response regulator n=1 Tax=Agromyces sp. M3QZ16-3 TaxID=3447585 RepID=UPI003F68C7F3
MSDASLAVVISSAFSLVAALAWPMVILVLIMRFRRPLGTLVQPIAQGIRERIEGGGGGEATLAFAGVSFSGRIDAASELVATATTQPGVAGGRVTTDQARQVLNEAIPDDKAAAHIEGSAVLWVDDNPKNNTFVVDALQQLGVAVTLVLSTRQAIELLEFNSFDAIISDMGRQEPDGYHDRAGYEFLSELRRADVGTPFFIYAGSNLRRHKEEAAQKGAQGSTNRPAELISLVTSALVTGKHQPSRPKGPRSILSQGRVQS